MNYRRRRALVSTALLAGVLGTAPLTVSAEDGNGTFGSGSRTGDGVTVGLLEEGGGWIGSGNRTGDGVTVGLLEEAGPFSGSGG